MKPHLRALSLRLVQYASLAKNGGQISEVNVLDTLSANIQETLSLFEIAFIAGLVSEMNFTILKREYASLRDTIDIKKMSRESRTDSILGDNFFGISEPASHPSPRPDLSGSASYLRSGLSPRASVTIPKGHSIGQTASTMSDRNVSASSPRSDLKKLGPKVRPLYEPSHTPRAITDVAKESRRTRILKLVKDNREVTIKDIATHFADLSEKTIQRELMFLAEGGVLKKFGERRWSRYALA